jgi:O-acetyl-ADP-ribose deacetylase
MTILAKNFGNIIHYNGDAIVNAANVSLLGGGGVDGDIHKSAGPKLLSACKEIRKEYLPDGLPVGESVITSGFDLPAKWIIHTVGPKWRGGRQQEKELLAKCYENSLALAVREGIKSIAFPTISTGNYHFPEILARQISEGAIKDFVKKHPSIIGRIDLIYYRKSMNEVFETTSEETV